MKLISKSDLSELIGNDIEIRRRIVHAITEDPDFRKRMAYEIATEIVECKMVLEWRMVDGR